MTSNALIIGLIAGAASALLALSAASGTALSFVLYVLSPAPLLTAMLGWGARAGAIAAIVAVALAALLAFSMFGTAKLGVFVALVVASPALVAGYYLGLARPAGEVGGPNGSLAWFPLGGALFGGFVAIGFGVFALFLLFGVSEDVLREAVSAMVQGLREANPQTVIDDADEAALQDSVLAILPGATAFAFSMVFSLCVYVALFATRVSGRLPRPRDEWPAMLRMPRAALVLLALAFAGDLLLPGMAAKLSSALSGALSAGFLLAGLARLHHLTRGKPVRPLVLWVTYVAIALIALPAFALFIFGLLDTRPTPLLLSQAASQGQSIPTQRKD
ncbi:MAG TPA: DUF2232 domain-containing protein [Rhizobiaceae bacterium]|nr:DUF2232 domain-containing protein [Rhizobiaceae bacterium]